MTVNTYLSIVLFLTLSYYGKGGRPFCLCMQVTQCLPYVNSVNYAHTFYTQQTAMRFWRSKFCGYTNGIPRVCCENLPSISNVDTIKLIEDGSLEKAVDETLCLCTSVNQCFPYVYTMNNLAHFNQPVLMQFWREKFCGYDNGISKVCCVNILPSNVSLTRTVGLPRVQERNDTAKTMEQNKREKSENTTVCSCILIPYCKPFERVARDAGSYLKLILIRYFRSQECGFEGRIPKVCCPNRSNFTIDDVLQTFSAEELKEIYAMSEADTTISTPVPTEPPKIVKPTQFKSWNLEQKSQIFNAEMADFGFFDLVRRKFNSSTDIRISK